MSRDIEVTIVITDPAGGDQLKVVQRRIGEPDEILPELADTAVRSVLASAQVAAE